MDKNYLKGLKQGLGFITIIFLAFSVYAVGFHQTSEIVPGIFQGNYAFNGSLSIGDSKNQESLDLYGNISLNNKSNQIYWNWKDRAILETDSNGNSSGGEVIRFKNSMTASHGNPEGGFEFTDDTENLVMKITNRDVGIGTSNPKAKLDVNGSISVDGFSNITKFTESVSSDSTSNTKNLGKWAFCALSRVHFNDGGRTDDDAYCEVYKSGGNWYLRAWLGNNGFTRVVCDAFCLK